MNKLLLLLIIICLSAAGIFHFMIPAPPLRVALDSWLGYQTLTLTSINVGFDTHQVELIATPSLSDSVQLLKNGKVDAAALTFDEVLALRDQGTPLTIVTIIDSSAGGDLLLTRPEITSLAGLKGKRIGLENSVLGHLMLNEILQRGGLRQDDVTLSYEIVSKHPALWRQHKVDALISYLPLTAEILAEANRLFDSSEIPNTIIDVLAVRSDRLDDVSPQLRYLLVEYFSTLKQLRGNSLDSLHRLAYLVHRPVEETVDMLHQIHLHSLQSNKRLLSADHSALLETQNKLTSIMLPAGLLEAPPNRDGLTDDAYLPQEAAP